MADCHHPFYILPMWKDNPLLLDIARNCEHSIQPIKLQTLRGQTVGVDAHTLLYRAIKKCHPNHDIYRQVAVDIPSPNTPKHLRLCIDMIRALESNDVTPILVFHGRTMPFLEEYESGQASKRKQYLDKALTIDDDCSYSKYYEARNAYRKACYISPPLVSRLMKELKKHQLKFYFAPFDANAQLAFMLEKNHIDAVITDDPSLILFGCPKIIFKMDYKSGNGYEFQVSNLFDVGNPDYAGFTKEILRAACLLTGCSYSPYDIIPISEAYSIFKYQKDFDKVLKSVAHEYDNGTKEAVEREVLAYQYQDVYDPITMAIVPLSEPTEDVTSKFGNFLSSFSNQPHNIDYTEGNIDPVTMERLEEENIASKKQKTDYEQEFKILRRKHFNGWVPVGPYYGIYDYLSDSSDEEFYDEEYYDYEYESFLKSCQSFSLQLDNAAN